MARVRAQHFLQEDDVRAHRAHRVAQLGQDELAVERREALVGVHRHDFERSRQGHHGRRVGQRLHS